MTPLALRMTNFRSVRGSQTFNFPSRPGLYFMQGVNEVESRLEANGAGKSTVWEALTWCYFGKTSRGLKAGEVCNWEAGKGAEVAFIFMREDEGGAIYNLKRTWSPNAWTLDCDGLRTVDLAKEKDNPALAWLALDFEQWLNCVLMAQGQPMFLDLKREAQATLFSAVVGADNWLDYSARSSKLSGAQDDKVRDMERDLARAQGELDATLKGDWQEQGGEWERSRKQDLANLEAKHEEGLVERKRLAAEYREAEERVTNARAWVARSQVDPGLDKDYNRARADVSDCALLLSNLEGTSSGLRDQLVRLDKDENCPVCGQSISEAHRRAEVRQLERKLRELGEQRDQLQRQKRASEEQEARLGEDVRKQEGDRADARDELDDAVRAMNGKKRDLGAQDDYLDGLEERHERRKAERNPYAEAKERAREEARELRARIDSLQSRIDSAGARQSLYQFWVRGFKDVRLMKIDEALTELEIEVNSGVDALGLLGWELQFHVDRETKAGKIERGFHCLVRSPHNAAAVPWEAWSGGEAQRLRLAGTMGLSDLIRSRSGAEMPLEIWDEPTQGLSPQGMRDLLECLRERAQRERRCIWLVDHRTHDFGGFEGMVVVRKTARGTIIEGV